MNQIAIRLGLSVLLSVGFILLAEQFGDSIIPLENFSLRDFPIQEAIWVSSAFLFSVGAPYLYQRIITFFLSIPLSIIFTIYGFCAFLGKCL